MAEAAHSRAARSASISARFISRNSGPPPRASSSISAAPAVNDEAISSWNAWTGTLAIQASVPTYRRPAAAAADPGGGRIAEAVLLMQEAKVNSKDNFLLVFGGAFENEMLKTEDTNKAFFKSFFSDETFRAELIAGVGEEFHRRNSGDQVERGERFVVPPDGANAGEEPVGLIELEELTRGLCGESPHRTTRWIHKSRA